MSKKNLARSLVEGGRSVGYRIARDQTNRTERHEFKQYLNQISEGSEDYDEGEDPISMEPIDKNYEVDYKSSHSVKPLKRYLRKHVNENWDKTYSKIREDFDARTPSGRILLDTLTYSIHQGEDLYRQYAELVVDEEGILREQERYSHRYTNPKVDWESALPFLQNRKVGQYPNGDLYWFEPVKEGVVSLTRWDNRLSQLLWGIGKTNAKIVYIHKQGQYFYSGGFRQGKKLTNQEKNEFFSLHRLVQEDILLNSPIHKKEKKAA